MPRVCPWSAVTVIMASLVLAWSVTSVHNSGVRCPTRPTTLSHCPLPIANSSDNAHMAQNPLATLIYQPPSFPKPNPLQLAVAAAIGQTNIYFRSFSFKQCAKALPHPLSFHFYTYIYIFFHASHFKLKIRKKHYGSHAHSGSEEKILITAFCEDVAAAGG